MDKIKLWETILHINQYELEGNPDEVIEFLKDAVKDAKDKFPGCPLRFSHEYREYCEEKSMRLEAERLENDEEYIYRITEDDRLKEYRRRQYEQLKKEFE